MTTVPKSKTTFFNGMRYCFIYHEGIVDVLCATEISSYLFLNLKCCSLKGKGTGIYDQCYYGPQKQYRVTKLSPASRYSFRLAAKNDMGAR